MILLQAAGAYGLPEGIDIDKAISCLVVMGAVTVALRWFPFIAGKNLRESPLFGILGRSLPLGIMIILVIYIVSTADGGVTVSALIGVAVAAGLHLWRRNMLLSLSASTAIYMLLVAAGI